VFRKNDIRELGKGNNIPIALTPCQMSECYQWESGKCIHSERRGRPDRRQVFSKPDQEKLPFYRQQSDEE